MAYLIPTKYKKIRSVPPWCGFRDVSGIVTFNQVATHAKCSECRYEREIKLIRNYCVFCGAEFNGESEMKKQGKVEKQKLKYVVKVESNNETQEISWRTEQAADEFFEHVKKQFRAEREVK